MQLEQLVTVVKRLHSTIGCFPQVSIKMYSMDTWVGKQKQESKSMISQEVCCKMTHEWQDAPIYQVFTFLAGIIFFCYHDACLPGFHHGTFVVFQFFFVFLNFSIFRIFRIFQFFCYFQNFRTFFFLKRLLALKKDYLDFVPMSSKV